jgi:hypothetical protein
MMRKRCEVFKIITALGFIYFLISMTIASAQTCAATAKINGKYADDQPGEFVDKSLNLSFRFPIEMKRVDMEQAMENGHEAIYGAPGDTDPEHLEAKRCILPLLDAELPCDYAPKRMGDLGGMWVDDSPEYKKSRKPEPITAQILMVEIKKSCLPKPLQKNENDALGNIALSSISIPGILPGGKPIWYEVGKQKIHMNSGIGRPIIKGVVAPAPIIIMSMATKWHGHYLAWVFTSNDREIFNEITKSPVKFGNQDWGSMFFGNLDPKGSGTPMKILPK